MTRFVTLSTGVTLEYVERGRPDGIPVVFLHGVTDSWRSFEHVLTELPPSIRAIAITQRGHGDSSRPDAGYGFADMSNDLRAFLDAHDLSSAVIVGHSMGASVAQQFAIDHPARVAGLVLVGAFVTIQGHAGIQEFWDVGVSTLRDPIDPAFAREFQESTLAHPIVPAQLDTFVHESLKVPARVWQALFKGFLETPGFAARLTRVAAPTLILWGDRDAFAPGAHQEVLRTSIPGASLKVYEGVGHALHWEDAAGCAADVASFATRCWSGRRTADTTARA